MKKELISFVIPCYRSEKTIEAVIAEIINKVTEKQHKYEYEIVAVNDSSPDNVIGVLSDLARDNMMVKVVSLAKNMGKPCATMAGFAHSNGDIIVLLDDDGQCPLNALWDLIDPIENGHAAAIAKYPHKKQSAFKNFGSKLNDLMLQFTIDKPKTLQISNFIALKRFVVHEILKYDKAFPFFSGLLLRTTRDVVNVFMEERERIHGRTTMTLKKMVSTWLNGLTAFSIKPLRLASVLGVISAICGILWGVIVVVNKICHPEIQAGYSSIMATILLLGGLNMLLLGMIGEYLGRIYISINKSPQYVVLDTINICNNMSETR